MEGIHGQWLDQVLRHLVEHHGFQGGAFLIYLLDLVGTLAFAITGGYETVQSRESDNQGRLDVFGVMVGAIFTAIGGGSIRSLFASKPPFVIACPEYLGVAIWGGLLVVCAYRWVKRYFAFWLFIDAMGVGVFSAIGANMADSLDWGAHTVIFFAALTAAGGGCIRDVVARRVPGSFSAGSCYALSAAVAGFGYILLNQLTNWPQPGIVSATVIVGFAARTITGIFDIHLPFIEPESGKFQWPERRPRIILRPVAKQWAGKVTRFVQTVFSLFF